jgi:hypothetical protein
MQQSILSWETIFLINNLFQAAIDLFEKAKNMCHDETLHNEVELYISLAQAFNAWDKFDHEQAKKYFYRK